MVLIRGKKLLKQIFSENWQQFVSEHPNIRPAILKNVDKMLKCGTEEMGFHLYQCPECRIEKKVPHTCKSRFCSSCGVAQTDIWIERQTTLFANSQYQHVIFHPPSEFRPYFGIGRTPYFNALYTSVNLTLKDWYTREGYLPGMMTYLFDPVYQNNIITKLMAVMVDSYNSSVCFMSNLYCCSTACCFYFSNEAHNNCYCRLLVS